MQVGGAWAGAVQEQCLRAWARDKVMARLMGRGSPLDPSNGMLQIAAYLQHICCTWQFLKNHKCRKNETSNMVSLESIFPTKFHDAAATRSAAAICCSIFAAHLRQMAVSQKL